MRSAQAQLPDRLSGKVVTPQDTKQYALLRSTYSAVRSPAYVILVRDEGDVAAALAFAQEHGFEVAVRSGGHSLPGASSNDGGVVIDLSSMNAIEVLDRGTRLVRVQAGARWAQVAAALAPHGMSISSGDHGNVGVGGLGTSGGIGWMAREHGLTIDRIRWARIVLADGTAREVDAHNEPDLFWAIRGGGSLMGIVTEFRFEATSTATVAIGQFEFAFGAGASASAGAGVLAGWDRFLRAAPRSLTATMRLFGHSGGVQASMTAVVATDDERIALAALRSAEEIGRIAGRSAQFAPYRALLPASHLHPNVGQQQAFSRNGMIDSLTAEVESGILEVLGSGAMVQMVTLGGAVADVPPDDTAFANRRQSTLVVGTAWSTGQRGPMDHAWKRLAPSFSGAYGNFESLPTEQTIALAFPARTRQRLLELKRRYDPAGVFARWPE